MNAPNRDVLFRPSASAAVDTDMRSLEDRLRSTPCHLFAGGGNAPVSRCGKVSRTEQPRHGFAYDWGAANCEVCGAPRCPECVRVRAALGV